MKTKSEQTESRLKKRPLYSVNRLSELLGVDRRTLKTALDRYDDPQGKGPNGPLYTKHGAVSALLAHRRRGIDLTPSEVTVRLMYGCSHGVLLSPECFEALERYDLAQWRGVDPDDLNECLD